MIRARGLWLVFGTEVILTSGLALSFPFFALYLSRERGLPIGTVGALLSAALFLVAVSQGLGGELSDVLGRRRVMAWSMGARGLLTLALAEGVRRGGSPGLLVGLYMAGAFVGNFYGPASRGWVADRCGPGDRVRAYGLLRVAVNVGWALGPALGGALAESSYAAMFYVTAAACLACALIAAFLIPDGAPPSRSDAFSPGAALGALADPRLRRFCLGVALIGLAMSFLVVPLSVHCARYLGLGEGRVGLLFSLNGLLVVATLPWMSPLLSRRRITASMAVGSLLYAAGYSLVGFAGGFWAVAAGVCVVSMGEVAVSPGLHALAANLAPEALKGRYLGVASFAHVAGFAAAPFLGGVLLESLSPRWLAGPWLAVAVVALLAAAVFRALGRRVGRREEGLSEPRDARLMEGIS